MRTRVAVGSKNPVKIMAAGEVLREFLGDIEIIGIEVQSKVPGQPVGIEEGVSGAIGRAEEALQHGDIGVGIEAGLVRATHSRTGYLDIHFCAIKDSELSTLGSSSGFELPAYVIEEVNAGKTVGEAIEERSGIKGVGTKDGAVGFLSRGRITRFDLARQAVLAAMIPRIRG